MFAGVLGAAWLLWLIYASLSRGSRLHLRAVIPLLMLVLVAMLLTRQLLQNKTILPLEKQAAANAREYHIVLQPYVQTTLSDYQAALGFSYNNAETIYRQSCAFCHGQNADGNGPEGRNLVVPARTCPPCGPTGTICTALSSRACPAPAWAILPSMTATRWRP